MEQRVLDFKEKIEKLSLDELKSSIQAREISGYSRTLPVEHFQLWEDILETLDKKNIQYDVQHICAAGGKNARRIKRVEEQIGKDTLGATWLQKLIGKIIIKDLANDESSASLGIAFHDKGIQVSYGQNIIVCNNFSIMNASNTVTTFGKNSFNNYGNFLQVINAWITEHEKLRKSDLDTIETMKTISIDEHNVMPSIIGKLQMKAVEATYLKGKTAPFNIGQVSTFTKNYLESKSDNVKNLWELYNHGTNIMKPEIVDISTLQPQIIQFTNFINEEFSVN
ncbi:MAG TPA: hypothetical protein VKN74_02765 [Candidatus Mcinerneyibacterium sp.]|nr:hypothetical protein [Candidatus Mcinerneyibacterium sp.]